MKRLGIIGMVGILACSCGGSPKEQDQEDRITPVSVYKVQTDSITNYMRLIGRVEAGNDAFVYSKTTETIDRIDVELGDRVRKDQVLAVQRNQALSQAVEQAQASVRSTESQYVLAQVEFDRTDRLAAEEAVSQQEYDQADAQLKAARAAFEQAQAALGQVEEQYENSILKAPFSGIVARTYYEAGQMVSANQPVFQIVDTKTIKAKAWVPEKDIANVFIGQTALGEFPAFPETQFAGSVSRIDEAIDTATRQLEIEVSFENTDGRLKSGMFGEYSLKLDHHVDTIVISDQAVMTQTELITNDDGSQDELISHYLFVADNGKAVRRAVTPGIEYQGKIEILAGLTSGELLIVSGQNIVSDGAAIQIVEN